MRTKTGQKKKPRDQNITKCKGEGPNELLTIKFK